MNGFRTGRVPRIGAGAERPSTIGSRCINGVITPGIVRQTFRLVAVGSLQLATVLAAPTVTQVAAGSSHTLFTKSDGSLWGMGWNGHGQLGIGSAPSTTNIPVQIVASNVTAVSAGGFHSLFRKSNGSLWGMGGNSFGQLGDGTFNDQYFPEQIVSSQVSVISAGGVQVLGHSLFGKFHSPQGPGSLWTMGNNQAGQLGDGAVANTNVPQEILSTTAFGSPAVLALAAGGAHSLFTRPGGSLWAMGWNHYGQLGDGTTNDQLVAEQIVANNVVAIAASSEHSLFIKSDGSLWGMGGNSFGQLGDGTTTDHHVPELIVAGGVVAIAAGAGHSLFVKSDGSLWGMGDNVSGELGIGTNYSVFSTPQQILASNVIAVAAGWYYSLFIKSDGSLWGMGANDFGQLGIPSDGLPTFPVRIVPAQVVNGGFETGNFLGWTTNGNVSNTDVSSKGLYVHSGRYGAQLGPAGSLGYLSQPLATTAGAQYVLSFWLNCPDGETPSEFVVAWDGKILLDLTNPPALGWTNVQLRVSATVSGSMLQFGFRNDFSYFGLDDISLVIPTQPTITGIKVAGTNLILSGTDGQSGRTYYTLMTTDIALPLSRWTPVATNALTADGDFTFTATNAVNPAAAQQFFILQTSD
jgi:alpha-tubulin suppressor-like RCC1 family protein